jgi:hypothetical protein
MDNAKPFILSLVLTALVAACGGEASAPATSSTASTVAGAAVKGLDQAAALTPKRPIPRDGIPDALETMEGGSYLRSSNIDNGDRVNINIMYTIDKTPAEAVSFYQASFLENGFTASAPVETVKPSKISTYMDANGPDERRINVQVIQETDSTDTVVDIRYSEKSKK